MDRIAAVEALGVKVRNGYRYEGEPGKGRHQVTRPEVITGVYLPLTAEEWVSTCSRNGANYIGGCCGNTSDAQNQINGALRDGGWIDSDALLYVGRMLNDHEGFEEFGGLRDERFKKLVTAWKKQDEEGLPEGYEADVWVKIGIIYSAVEPLLQPEKRELPRPESKDDAVRVLHEGLTRIYWSDLFGDSPRDDLRHQDDANAILTRAKILGPLRRVLAEVEACDDRLEGYALVQEGTDEVLINGNGACVYLTREDAQRWLDLMNRYDEMEEGAEEMYRRPLEVKGEIVPCVVTVPDGLKIMR